MAAMSNLDIELQETRAYAVSYPDFVCLVFLTLQREGAERFMLTRAAMDRIYAAYENGESVADAVESVSATGAAIPLH